MERAATSCGAVRPTKSGADDEHPIALESRICRRHPAPAAKQQRRADDQNERQRHLRDHQRFADAKLRVSFSESAAVRLHGRVWIDATCTPGGRKPEENPRRHRDGNRESKNTQVNAEVEPHGAIGRRHHAHEHARAPHGESGSGGRSEERENDAFRQQLSDEPAPANKRLATLAQAISKTSPTTDISTQSAFRYCVRISERPAAAGSTPSLDLR